MPEVSSAPFSYRADPMVPAFEGLDPLFVFDGECVLCSSGASWIMRRDRSGKVRFASSQSALGQALYRHYGVDPDATYLLIADGRAYSESRGYLEMCRILGGAWRALTVFRLIPEGLRDGAYRLVARNRYRWFGRAEHCALLSPEQKERLVSGRPAAREAAAR